MVMPNVARAGLPEHWRTMRCEPKGITGFAGDGVNRFGVMPVFSVSVAGSGGKCSLMVGWIRGIACPVWATGHSCFTASDGAEPHRAEE